MNIIFYSSSSLNSFHFSPHECSIFGSSRSIYSSSSLCMVKYETLLLFIYSAGPGVTKAFLMMYFTFSSDFAFPAGRPTSPSAAGKAARTATGLWLASEKPKPMLTQRRSARRTRHRNLFWKRKDIFAVRKGDLKLVCFDGGPVELYNLADDPGESNDLIATQPLAAEGLRSIYDAWVKRHEEPRW